MIQVKSFTFNPFQENTYVLFDERNECVIIDPGCLSSEEQNELSDFISQKKLKPVRLLNTHCHIDHVLGNRFVSDRYKVGLEIHPLDLPVLHALPGVAKMYGVQCNPSPEPVRFLEENDIVQFGNSELKVVFAPGHAPGHIFFYSKEGGFTISGDILFHQSIGRTDLPGGDYDTLIDSIRTKMFVLPDETMVYSGHGMHTTIGYEKKHNPFLN